MIWHTWSRKRKKKKEKEKKPDNFEWLYFTISRSVCWQHQWRESHVRNTCYSYFTTKGLVRPSSNGISIISCICSCSMCGWGRNTLYHIQVIWISNLSLTLCERQIARFMEGVDPKLVTAWYCLMCRIRKLGNEFCSDEESKLHLFLLLYLYKAPCNFHAVFKELHSCNLSVNWHFLEAQWFFHF